MARRKKQDRLDLIDELGSSYFGEAASPNGSSGKTKNRLDLIDRLGDDYTSGYDGIGIQRENDKLKVKQAKKNPLASFANSIIHPEAEVKPISEADRRKMMRTNTGQAQDEIQKPSGQFTTKQLEERRRAEQMKSIAEVSKNKPVSPQKSDSVLSRYEPGVTEKLLNAIPDKQLRRKLTDVASVPENLVRGLGIGTDQMVAGAANLGSLAERVITGKDRSAFFDPLRDDFEKAAQELAESGNVLPGPVGNFTRTAATAVPEILTTVYGGGALAGVASQVPWLAKTVAKFPGLVKMLPFSTLAGSHYAREAQQEGANNWQQALYGLADGALEGLTEKYLFGNLEEVLSGGKKALQKSLINIPFEAGQEAGIDPLTGLAKKGIYKHDMPWYGEGGVVDPGQMGEDALAGAGTAALLGGAGMAVNVPMRNSHLVNKMHYQLATDMLNRGMVDDARQAAILSGAMVQGAVKGSGGVNNQTLRRVAKMRQEIAAMRPVGEVSPETQEQIDQVAAGLRSVGVAEEETQNSLNAAITNGLMDAGESLKQPVGNELETPQMASDVTGQDEIQSTAPAINLGQIWNQIGTTEPEGQLLDQEQPSSKITEITNPTTDDHMMPQDALKIKPEKNVHSDTGGYSDIEYIGAKKESESAAEANDINALAVEMPEMLELVKSINEGKNPLLKKKLGKALGQFVYSQAAGDIKLRRDIFIGERLGALELNPRKNIDQQMQDFTKKVKKIYGDQDIVFKRDKMVVTAYHRNPDLAARVLAHEIGHLVDWLPDQTLSRGNILGRVASLKSYLKHLLPEHPGMDNILTDHDRRRLRAEAQKLTKAEQNTPEPEAEGIKPEDILAIWNDVNARAKHPDLFKYVSRLGRAEKSQILREAMRGMVKFQLPDSKGKEYKDWSARKKELYRKLVKEEIVKRRLFEVETVRDELKGLTRTWKPFDDRMDQRYTQYRYSSPELYADAISVLLNNPSLLQKTAPTFYRAFFNYLGEKPEVKAVYDEIQARLGDKTATLDKRLDDVYRMFTEGHLKRNLLNQRRHANIQTVMDTVLTGLVDKNQGFLKLIRQGEKQVGPVKELARKARWEIEETGYISSEATNYLYDVGNDVLKLLQENNLTVDDVGTYMMLKRIASDRTEMANPLGHTEKTATETLKALKQRLGEDGYQKLEEGVEKYREIREKLIMPRVREGRLFGPELLEVMDSQKNYAKFNVQHYLEETYGPGTTARVYKQVGTLNEIENPFVVTVLQDISMLRAAKINEAKLAAISFLQQINNLNTKALSQAKKDELITAVELNIITPAETRYDGVIQKLVPVEPKDPNQALLQVMVDGNLHSFYVGKEIAATFEYHPFEATKVAEIWGGIMSPVKSALVSKNVLWMARNLIRDLRTTYKNVPELKGFKSTAKFLKYYGQAFGEASRAVFKDNRSEDIAAMQKNFMLNPDRMYSSRERNFENDLERLSEEFQLDIYDEKEAKTVVGRMRTFLKLLDKAGRVSEMTGKLAGYKFLTHETSRSQDEIAHVVRTRIGTPDTRRVGKWHQVVNNFFLFSNVNKEGWRAAGESFKEDPGTYIWKTILVNCLPKLFLLGLGSGILKLLGFDDDDKWGKTVKAIPEYDKRSYNIIPLGMTGEGKAVYLRLPEDYEGQVFGGIMYQLCRGRMSGKNSVTSTLAEQSPYDLENPNPLYGVGHDLVQYYLFHQNPVDEYRGRNVLPDSIFKAGGWQAHQSMATYAWKSFGGDAIITPVDDLDETLVQEAFKYPPFNILGTFCKISDRGKLDEYYAAKDREAGEKARETLKLKERIVESVAGLKKEPGVSDIVKLYHQLRKDEILPKSRSFGEFRRQYINYAAYAVKDKTLSTIMAADTKEDRQKLLAQAKNDLTPQKFYELKAKLRKMGVVIPNR